VRASRGKVRPMAAAQPPSDCCGHPQLFECSERPATPRT
jgi:hypothetical protein